MTAPQYPPTAQHGVRDGLLVAKDIEGTILGRPRRPAVYRIDPMMVVGETAEYQVFQVR